VELAALAERSESRREAPQDLSLRLYSDLDAAEAEWRRFEEVADCTVFQTFDWLATWHRHIGLRAGVQPAVAVGRFGGGETAFLLPLGVAPHGPARRLCWLGQELCDYNAPLIARDFSARVTADRFLAAWTQLCQRLQRDPLFRHDWIELEKMPETLGAQRNPFTYLDVSLNASGAHLTQLGGDWEKFYAAKRSSATRRRDRAKRRHISQYGDIRFVTTTDVEHVRCTLETLIQQKSRALARRGVADMFARPGWRDFFFDLATNPKTRHLVHIARLEVGAGTAAANFGIMFGGCYYHVLASYCEESDVARFGPGGLHLRELLEYAIGRGLRRFDFTIGDERYKLEWCDTELKLYDYAAAATWRGWPACQASITRRRLKRFIKQTPWAWHAVSRARAALGALAHPALVRPGKQKMAVSAAAQTRPPLACVMGDMDLLRPLTLAGIPCAVVTRRGVPSLYSRAARYRFPWDDFSADAAGLVEALVSFASTQPERPVLFYEEDAQLLVVSRFRERLAQAFRFVVAEAQLVEDLLDKARFQALAQRYGLPVPAGRGFDPAAIEPAELGLNFPLLIKPLTRLEPWNASFGLHKALNAENAEELRRLWPRLRALGIGLLAQELVPGAEARIESYHCYVDQRGAIAGEFTGRKIRTLPLAYGHTTALEITEATDVARQGRAIVERLALRILPGNRPTASSASAISSATTPIPADALRCCGSPVRFASPAITIAPSADRSPPRASAPPPRALSPGPART
jgi:CelD/BcsL family acetyltransferase involved in cellulose biosynthesis